MIGHYATLDQVEAFLKIGWMLKSYYGERGGRPCFILIWPCACTMRRPDDYQEPDSAQPDIL